MLAAKIRTRAYWFKNGFRIVSARHPDETVLATGAAVVGAPPSGPAKAPMCRCPPARVRPARCATDAFDGAHWRGRLGGQERLLRRPNPVEVGHRSGYPYRERLRREVV